MEWIVWEQNIYRNHKIIKPKYSLKEILQMKQQFVEEQKCLFNKFYQLKQEEEPTTNYL